MEKEDSKNKEENQDQTEKKNIDTQENNSTNNNENLEDKEQEKALSPEEEIDNLKDKLARTLAEMENQRRRFEKEKEDAFEYGGFSLRPQIVKAQTNLATIFLSLHSLSFLFNSLKTFLIAMLKLAFFPPHLAENIPGALFK